MRSFREADRMLRVGFGDPEEGRGRYFFAKKRRYEGGAELLYESVQGRDECVVDLSGAVLGTMEQWESWQLLGALFRAGFTRVTRLDVALDFKAEDVRLVEAVRASCERAELTGAKRYGLMTEFVGVRLATNMVRIGRRGNNGSGRFARVYDKGLESGKCGANKWHRFEVEYTGEVAGLAFSMLLQAELPGVDGVRMGDVARCVSWEQQAVAMVLGAFDFREANGSRELKRRPRCKWWSALLGAVEGVRMRAKKAEASSLERTATWIRRCVMPTLVSMARRTGQEVGSVLGDIVGELDGVKPVSRVCVFEYVCQYLAVRSERHGGH